VRLHRIVVLERRLVRLIDDHLGRLERGVRIALSGVGLILAVYLFGRIKIGAFGAERRIVTVRLVLADFSTELIASQGDVR